MLYGDACMSINNAMQLIGYLLQIVDDEDIQETTLSVIYFNWKCPSQLPRISEALSQNERLLITSKKKRKGG